LQVTPFLGLAAGVMGKLKEVVESEPDVNKIKDVVLKPV